jgi:hypothetical protein
MKQAVQSELTFCKEGEEAARTVLKLQNAVVRDLYTPVFKH